MADERFLSRLKTAKEFYKKEGKLLHKYNGGIPIGFMCAIAEYESGCKMSSSGDVNLGEVGYYQITGSAPKQFCVDPNVRRIAEGNIFLANLEYATNAARLQVDFPEVIQPGSADQWLISRLTFAVGYSGTTKLIKAANPRYGHVYEDVLKWAKSTGGMSLGNQSASKVLLRITNVAMVYLVGANVYPTQVGLPTKIPAPNGITYCLPGSVKGIMTTGGLVNAGLGIGSILASMLLS